MATNIPSTMRAWQFTSTAGGLEKNLKLNNTAPLPPTAHSLGKDKVLVKVLSTSLNPVDYKIAEVPIIGRLIAGSPSTPGLDYVGRVVACGPESGNVPARNLQPGQLVFGRLDSPSKYGVLAEYTVAPRTGCEPLPEGVRVDDAAGVGTAALTAYQSIVPNTSAGSRVFIHGGSGGTGTYGIQIAKALGCFVATSCSTRNVELCAGLGADVVLDYQTQDLVRGLAGMETFDLVVDNVGDPIELFYKAHTFTKPEAKYVQVGIAVSLGGFLTDIVSRLFLPSVLGGGKRRFELLGVKNQLEGFGKIA